MDAKRWKAKRLAKEADLTEGAVSRHLRSQERPRLESIEKYEAALGIELLPRPARQIDARSSAPPVGRGALEHVLCDIEWPDPFDVVAADRATAVARAEADGDGALRPASIWRSRLLQLYRESVGHTAPVTQSGPVAPTPSAVSTTVKKLTGSPGATPVQPRPRPR